MTVIGLWWDTMSACDVAFLISYFISIALAGGTATLVAT